MNDTTRDIAMAIRREVTPEGAKRLGLVIGIIRREVDIMVIGNLALDSALAGQTSQGVFGLNMQGVGQLRRAVSLVRALHPDCRR